MSINNIIEKLESKINLNDSDLTVFFNEFKDQNVNDEQIRKIILAWHTKNITANELSTLANIINQNQNQNIKHKDSIDTCGTGGDKANTFNISTLAAIITASCGLKVIKHSGRSSTSISGSVDILSEFGLNIDLKDEDKEKCFSKTNLMFASSALLRKLFSQVKTICKELNTPSFVNLLGPLTNPYKTSFHLLGVSNINIGKLMSEATQFNNKETFIVCSKLSEDCFLDELSFSGTNYLWKITADNTVKQEIFSPSELGEETIDINKLKINNKNESKQAFEDVLKGNPNTLEKIKTTALNSGALLYLTKRANSLQEGYKIALKHIGTGKPWEHFGNFISCINDVYNSKC